MPEPVPEQSSSRVSVDLTPAELALLQNALDTYLSDFGHEDHELVVQAHDMKVRLAALADTGAASRPAR